MPGPVPRRERRSDFQHTRRRIVEAARRLMGERGPESLTVSAVAHAAAINRTTAYQHFRTRDELVRGVTQHLKEHNLTSLVYFEECQKIDDALAREKQIKAWSRARKVELIESLNPSWDDLSAPASAN